MIKIFRKVFVNTFDDLDVKNVGCHWTTDYLYLVSVEFLCNQISVSSRTGKLSVVFEAECEESDILANATRESNDNYPIEFEVVLKPNTMLKSVKLFFRDEEHIYAEINTGTRYEDWVKKHIM